MVLDPLRIGKRLSKRYMLILGFYQIIYVALTLIYVSVSVPGAF